jgi:ADP-heptose:LPS heptosyltransferase
MPGEMKILVISLAGIGDTLFATPLFHELRANFPAAQIEALVLWAGARDLLENNPHLNAVHQKNLLRAGTLESLRFLWTLRRQRFDVSLNTRPQSRVHYRAVARFIHARLRLSHHYHQASRFDHFLVNRTLPQDYERHCIDNNLAFLSLLGAKPLLPRHDYELFLSPAELGWADDFIESQHLAGFKLLGIHAGSGGTKNLALRRWPLASYIELIRQLTRARPELRVLVFGGPDEEKDNETILASTDPERVCRPRTANLRQAAALVRKCALFLSVDTAFMHLAAAMKVPGQVVIETPTWNKPIEPYNQTFILVKNPAVAGRNLEFYRYDGEGIQGTAEEIVRCMASVKVEAVYEALLKALGVYTSNVSPGPG